MSQNVPKEYHLLAVDMRDNMAMTVHIDNTPNLPVSCVAELA